MASNDSLIAKIIGGASAGGFVLIGMVILVTVVIMVGLVLMKKKRKKGQTVHNHSASGKLLTNKSNNIEYLCIIIQYGKQNR